MGAREDSAGGSSYGDTYGVKNRYNMISRTYPEDLFDNASKYGNSWAMININVLTSSKAFVNANIVPLEEWEKKRFTDDIDAAIQESPSLTAAGAATTVGALVGVGAFLKNGKVLDSAKTGVGAAAATGAALLPLLAGNTRTTKRIDTAIMLPMPNQFTTSYSMQWSEDSTKLFDMATRFPHMAFESIKNALTGSTSSVTSDTYKDAALSISLGLQSELGAGGVSAASGLASNPKKEQIFNGVNFRSFSMNYMFYPKSASEALAIDNIISTLKYHMHPEYKSSGRFTFIYPSEFDITFYLGDGSENKWVSRIATCVLRDMTVNYAPSGQWVTKENGFPNMIEVSLVFQELSLLTKDAILKGF